MRTQIKYLWIFVEDLKLSYSFSSNKEKTQHFIGFSMSFLEQKS